MSVITYESHFLVGETELEEVGLSKVTPLEGGINPSLWG